MRRRGRAENTLDKERVPICNENRARLSTCFDGAVSFDKSGETVPVRFIPQDKMTLEPFQGTEFRTTPAENQKRYFGLMLRCCSK